MRNRRGPMRSIGRSILIVAVAAFAPSQVRAAEPQPYTVSIAATGNGQLDIALKAGSQLESLLPAGPIPPFALVGRAQQDVDRLQTVLHAFGYYQGKA